MKLATTIFTLSSLGFVGGFALAYRATVLRHSKPSERVDGKWWKIRAPPGTPVVPLAFRALLIGSGLSITGVGLIVYVVATTMNVSSFEEFGAAMHKWGRRQREEIDGTVDRWGLRKREHGEQGEGPQELQQPLPVVSASSPTLPPAPAPETMLIVPDEVRGKGLEGRSYPVEDSNAWESVIKDLPPDEKEELQQFKGELDDLWTRWETWWDGPSFWSNLTSKSEEPPPVEEQPPVDEQQAQGEEKEAARTTTS